MSLSKYNVFFLINTSFLIDINNHYDVDDATFIFSIGHTFTLNFEENRYHSMMGDLILT